MSTRATFAAGALLGALAVLVPFATVGHPTARVDRMPSRPAVATQPRAAAASPGGTGDEAASSGRRDPVEPKRASNTETCDVQLD